MIIYNTLKFKLNFKLLYMQRLNKLDNIMLHAERHIELCLSNKYLC